MTPLITLSRALNDPALFGRTFSAPSFWPWRTLSKVIDGIALTEPRETELFVQCTGRTQLPIQPVRRLILLAGRRAGKDRFMSAVAVWRAALCADWRKYQSAGEGAVVILLGADKKQARILRDYCEGLLRAPLLAQRSQAFARRADRVSQWRHARNHDQRCPPGARPQRHRCARIRMLPLADRRAFGFE